MSDVLVRFFVPAWLLSKLERCGRVRIGRETQQIIDRDELILAAIGAFTERLGEGSASPTLEELLGRIQSAREYRGYERTEFDGRSFDERREAQDRVSEGDGGVRASGPRRAASGTAEQANDGRLDGADRPSY